MMSVRVLISDMIGTSLYLQNLRDLNTQKSSELLSSHVCKLIYFHNEWRFNMSIVLLDLLVVMLENLILLRSMLVGPVLLPICSDKVDVCLHNIFFIRGDLY